MTTKSIQWMADPMLSFKEEFAKEEMVASEKSMDSLSWRNVTITAHERHKSEKVLLHSVSGNVQAGEMIAIMGPSGCGKTTLLNHLTMRKQTGSLRSKGNVYIDGHEANRHSVSQRLRYVESHDTLIGSLTVQETLEFAARFSHPKNSTRESRKLLVDDLLQSFGLYDQRDTIVGTVAQKGISTGQQRRLSVASQLTSAPQILVLDEPTSGLDSAASFTVMSYIREVAKAHNLIVVCSIHQPSTTTFNLFDKLLLLAEGKTCYFGAVSDVRATFDDFGYSMDLYTNPAEFILDLVNVEVARDKYSARKSLTDIQDKWTAKVAESDEPIHAVKKVDTYQADPWRPNAFSTFLAVLHRSWIKSHRDILVYGIRFGMYMGLAIMMGTVWLRLQPTQSNIQAYANCILFGSAFMSFMAVVYVPAFAEDRLVYIKDRENGLYGSVSFLVSNFIIGLPYLFLIAICTSAFTYWMVNFRPDGTAFMYWVLWMYLNLLAAESLVVFIAALIPNFIGALALTAMANGIWMACNGFMVAPTTLNPFYHYVFYFINYQAYVFKGLLTNEYGGRNYSCNSQCYCQYDTVLRDQCEIQGAGVLEQQYGFSGGSQGLWIGITIGIIAFLRLVGWIALSVRR